MARDYYDLLGVPRTASREEIKRAYRRLVKQHHPDVSDDPDAKTRLQEINEAYEVLSDDEKRTRYDHFGHAGVNGGAGSGFGGFGGMAGFEDFFEDFINSVGGFGARSASRRRGPRQGRDIGVDLTITFEESVFGVDKEIEFDRSEVCETCHGDGAEPGTSPMRCPQCGGSGEVRQVQQTFLGSMVRVSTCPRCNGRGEVIQTPCHTCGGSGRMRKRAGFTVKIPGGVREGTQLTFPREGDNGELSAPPGSLRVIVHVQEHAFFKRRDNDIILDITINVAQAALGDRVMIPTVDGDADLTIPAGTQTGKVFRLRGKGIPRLRTDGTHSGRGDMLIYVQVEIPTSLTPEQRDLFEKLAETMGSQIQPQSANGRGFFDRVMDFFSGEQS